MLIRIEVVTNFTESQNRLIGSLLLSLLSIDDGRSVQIKSRRGPVLDTAGAAWSRMVTYELRVNYLVEEVIARRLDEACIAYRQSEGPLFSMTWEGPGRRKDVPLRRAAYDLLEA